MPTGDWVAAWAAGVRTDAALLGERIAAFRRVARRRRPHLVMASVAAGLALAPAGPWAVLAAAVLVAGLALLAFGGRGAGVAVVLLVGAAAVGAARVAVIDAPARAAPPGSVIDAVATVLDVPRATRFGSSATLRIETGRARGLRVFGRVDRRGWPPDPGPGLRVRLRGLVLDPARTRRARPPSGAQGPAGPGAPSAANAGAPGTPGYGPLPAHGSAARDFDFAAFLRSRGIGRELKVESIEPVGRRGGPAAVVDSIRRRAERAIGTGLDPDSAALARGMVLGEDAGIADSVREDFQRSGLAHLLAASGANVALLCALALPFLMLARASPPVRVGVMLALVALYVPLAGAGASVQRAGIMAGAALVALASGRPGSAAYALLLAAALTLCVNPRVSGDPGWQLSFAAVTGMLVLGPHLRRLLRPLPRFAAEALGVTIAATLATAPLMAHEFGAVSLAALPANLLALPAVAPIMWLGMTEAALAQAQPLGHLPALAAAVVCRLAGPADGLVLRWVSAVAGRCAEPGWAQAPIRLSWPATAAAYLAIAAAVAAAARGLPRLRRSLQVRCGARLDLLDGWRALSKLRRTAAIALAGALVTLAASAQAGPGHPPGHLTVDYLDIGQGDATLVRDPGGAAVLFDGGPPEARVDRILRRLGVRRLSVVVATHQSRDHHGGLLEVVRRFPVGLFVDGGDGTRDPTFVALEREVDRRRIRRLPARRGDVLQIGAMVIRILWPGPRARGAPPGDPNLRATVAIVSERGFDLFLSADVESPVLLPLGLPRVDAMKVPHHGSVDPGLPQVLARLRPRVAAIEVGRGNDYGHPRPSTLNALRRAVPYVYRTDRDGTVELTVEDGRIDVRTHR